MTSVWSYSEFRPKSTVQRYISLHDIQTKSGFKKYSNTNNSNEFRTQTFIHAVKGKKSVSSHIHDAERTGSYHTEQHKRTLSTCFYSFNFTTAYFPIHA